MILLDNKCTLFSNSCIPRTDNNQVKNIYEYTNYREFLNDWCTERRSQSKAFSYRIFAKAAGISSPSYLKMVMEGERGLTPTTIQRFATALKLKKGERRFFEDLVFFNQAKTHTEKNHYYQRLTKHKKFRKAHHLTHDRFEYLTKWYYAAIREMVALSSFRNDPAWIARSLRPSISKVEAEQAIEVLLRLGLVEQNDEGRLILADRAIATSDEVNALAVANFHKTMIHRASEALHLCKGNDRNISSLTVAMSRDKFEKIKTRMHEFRKELRSILSDIDDAEEVYQINFQLFSLTEVENEA